MSDFDPRRAANDIAVSIRRATELLTDADLTTTERGALRHPGALVDRLQEVRRAVETASAVLIRSGLHA